MRENRVNSTSAAQASALALWARFFQDRLTNLVSTAALSLIQT